MFSQSVLNEVKTMKKDKQERNNILKQAKQRDDELKAKRKEKMNEIKQEQNKWKRFWKIIWYWITFPFIWIWQNIRDWRTAIIFVIVFLVVSCEVWIPYLLGTITWGTDFSKTMFGVGSACLFFWNCVPFTPFLAICITLTIIVKEIFNKLRDRKINNMKK